MKPFELVFSIRDAIREAIPALRSIEDLDIVVTIGLYQTRGEPVTAKVLSNLKVCTPATLLRRLSSLKLDGIVIDKVNPADGRVKLLFLSDSTLRAFDQLRPHGLTSSKSVQAGPHLLPPPKRTEQPQACPVFGRRKTA